MKPHTAAVSFSTGCNQPLYYQAPAWVFTLAYTLFGLLVLFVWWYFPPGLRKKSKNNGWW